MAQINLIPKEHRYRFPLKPIIMGMVLLFILAFGLQEMSKQRVAVINLEGELIQLENLLAKADYDKMLKFEHLKDKINLLGSAKQKISITKQPLWQDMYILSVLAEESETISLRRIEYNSNKTNVLAVQMVALDLGSGADYLAQIRQLERFNQIILLKGDSKGQGNNVLLDAFIFTGGIE